MQDMLVKLYDLPAGAETATPDDQDVVIRRAMAPDMLRVLEFVQGLSGKSATGECAMCFQTHPISCYIATRGKTIVGYACYNATAPDFFGPTAVLKEERGKGIGKALLLRSLASLREQGYGYAIIGGVGPAEFYEKCVGATLIPGSTPGVYKDFIPMLEE